ncbi:MAG: ankyrin repeat domain-containing protein [Wolbachia sp.]
MIQTYVKTKNSAKETSYQGANIVQYSDGKSIGDKDNSTVDKISLHSAVEIGDLSMITRLLSEGADLNAIDQHGWTPLHYAVHSGDVDLVRFLRYQGADYDINDCEGPVSDTFRCGSTELVQYFIDEEGVDHMTADERGLTLFGQAVVGGNLGTIEYLVTRKGSTYDGNNLLEIAILCGHLDVVEY